MNAANLNIFRLWSQAAQYGREGMSGALRIEATIELCRAYGETIDTFERILEFEKTVRPILVKKAEEDRELEEKNDR